MIDPKHYAERARIHNSVADIERQGRASNYPLYAGAAVAGGLLGLKLYSDYQKKEKQLPERKPVKGVLDNYGT